MRLVHRNDGFYFLDACFAVPPCINLLTYDTTIDGCDFIDGWKLYSLRMDLVNPPKRFLANWSNFTKRVNAWIGCWKSPLYLCDV